MLVGVAVLNSKSLAGVATLVLSHGLVKGALFLASGIVLLRLRSIDELRLHGRGRALPVVGALFIAGAIASTGLPYVGTYLGHAQIDEGATLDHIEWVQPLLMIASGIAAGAILRAGLRVFLGWGQTEDDLLTRQPEEEPERSHGGIPLLTAVTAVVLVAGLAASVVPGLAQRAEYGAERFRDRAGYAERVLHGAPMKRTEARLPFAVAHTGIASLLYGLGGVAIALATAAFGLWRGRLGDRVLGPPFAVLRAGHTGVIGDYVTWIVLGAAFVGGVWALTLR